MTSIRPDHAAAAMRPASPRPQVATTFERRPVDRPARSGNIVSYGAGEVCSDPECATLLSIYNDRTTCAFHTGSR